MPERREHPEIDGLLTRLDAISAPNRWDAVLDHGAHRSTQEAFPSPVRRLAIAGLALLVGVAGWGLVIASFRGHPPAVSSRTTSSALVQGGRLRCTATLPSTLTAGQDAGMRFTVTNITNRPVEAQLNGQTLGFILRAPDGTVYNSRLPAIRASDSVVLTKIAPHTSLHPSSADVLVRWGGPLTLTPDCLDTALAPLRATVRGAGSPATDAQAIHLVVAASAHLLDACRPIASGVPVDGQIASPIGSGPSMLARCSITLTAHDGFDLAEVMIISPPSLTGVRANPRYEDLNVYQRRGTAVAIAWDFVVTESQAIPVRSATQASTVHLAGGVALDWTWTGTQWMPGSFTCGRSQSGGGSGPGVLLVIPSGCP